MSTDTKSELFDLTGMTAMQIGRINKALDKLYRFSTATMTLRQFLEQRQDSLSKSIGNHSYKFDRRKFNRMDAARQKIYEANLNKPCYNVTYNGDFSSISVPKIVWEALTCPLRKTL